MEEYVSSSSIDVVGFLEHVDENLDRDVTGYLIGGNAIEQHDNRHKTDDVDLVISVDDEYQHFKDTVEDMGFEVTGSSPGREEAGEHDAVNTVYRTEWGVQDFELDIFDRKVSCGVELSDSIKNRAQFLGKGDNMETHVISPEDVVLNKLLSGRDKDYNHINNYYLDQNGGIDFSQKTVIDEMENQKPMYTGKIEADLVENIENHPISEAKHISELFLRDEHMRGVPEDLIDYIEKSYQDIKHEKEILDQMENENHSFETVFNGATDMDPDEFKGALDRLQNKEVIEIDDGKINYAFDKKEEQEKTIESVDDEPESSKQSSMSMGF